MKKLVVLMLVLGMAAMVNASPVMKLGDTNGAFTTGSSSVTVSAGATYDLFIWASSDIPMDIDSDEIPIPSTGLDAIQLFLQYDTSKVNLWSGAISKLSAVSGNPYGTAWTGKSQGTYDGLGFAEGALLPASVIDSFAMQKIFRVIFSVSNPGSSTTVTLKTYYPTSQVHDAFQGNATTGEKYYAVEGSMTFLPEPMTLVLLGLGGLFLRRRR